jgi:hypothetical protein
MTDKEATALREKAITMYEDTFHEDLNLLIRKVKLGAFRDGLETMQRWLEEQGALTFTKEETNAG